MSGLLLITDEAGRVVYVNRTIERMSGFRVPEAVGARPGKLWGGRMPDLFYRRMWRQISEERIPFSDIVDNQTKHGKPWESLLCIAPIGTSEKRLFVAMQPERGAWSVFRGRFHREWMSHASDAARLAGWMAYWLGGEVSAWEHNAGSGDALEWLSRAFIEPMGMRFASRVEDGHLLRLAKEDAHAFGPVYEKYWPEVRAYFRYHVKDPFEADDLAQDVFVKAFSSLDRYETRNATYKTFLMRIAHRTLLNRARLKTTLSIEDVPDLHSPHPLPDAEADRHVDLERVFAVLKLEERDLLEGFYVEGCSIRELAARTGKSENAVKVALSRIRRRFKQGR